MASTSKHDHSSSIDVLHVCRTCLAAEKDMHSILDKSIFDISYNAIVLEITGITISESDGLPLLICDACQQTASRAYLFKQQSEKADHTLRNLILKNNSNNLEGKDSVTEPLHTESELNEETVEFSNEGMLETKEIEFGAVDGSWAAEAKCEDETELYCSLCSDSFVGARALLGHVWTAHNEAMDQKQEEMPKREKNKVNNKKKVLKQDDDQRVLRKSKVRDVLEDSAEGRQILDIGLKTGALPASVRVRLCKLLLEKLMVAENPELLTDSQLLSLSRDIGRLFKKESPTLYYAPYMPADAYQSKRNISGWLVNARQARRTHFISLGLLTKPASRSRSSSKKINIASPSNCGINLQELEAGNPDKVASALEQLSSPSAGAWHEVSTLWRETVRARLHCLYYKEGTLQQYFEKYPILQSPNGWRLLTADYDSLFPDKGAGLQALEASAGSIVEAARSKATTTKDKYLRQRIADTLDIYDVNSGTKLRSAILLIGCLFNIPPTRRFKNDWRASRAEILDGFVTIVDTEADVQVTVDQRRRKLQRLDLTLQPFIVWCRDSDTAFAVCDRVVYKFPSLPEAVDATFKIFHATGAKYPTESYNVWLIIQIGFYSVRTSYDRMSKSVQETLLSLGLAL